jgi:toxin CptA
MHHAPSVSYPVGRSRFAGALLLVAWLLGAAACLAWRLGSPPDRVRAAAAAIAVAVSGSVAAWRWWRMPAGVLSWDQEQWRWLGVSAAGGAAPHVSLDLQHWLLLRWCSPAGSTWLWLERASRPGHWADFRRAVYSRARPEALPKAAPSGAKP